MLGSGRERHPDWRSCGARTRCRAPAAGGRPGTYAYARREDHRHPALGLGAERVHHRPDLVAITGCRLHKPHRRAAHLELLAARGTARAWARNIRFSVSPSTSSDAASLRVECDSMTRRSPSFCATLIQGSIRLTAVTWPCFSASMRLGIEPALRSSDSLTAAHEIGHLMGLGHANRSGNGAGLPIMLSHALCRRLSELRKGGALPWLRPPDTMRQAR